jgi:hypothetical protein
MIKNTTVLFLIIIMFIFNSLCGCQLFDNNSSNRDKYKNIDLQNNNNVNGYHVVGDIYRAKILDISIIVTHFQPWETWDDLPHSWRRNGSNREGWKENAKDYTLSVSGDILNIGNETLDSLNLTVNFYDYDYSSLLTRSASTNNLDSFKEWQFNVEVEFDDCKFQIDEYSWSNYFWSIDNISFYIDAA